ncbi:MAG: DUF6089 family protein [Bacteroidota bacterium]
MRFISPDSHMNLFTSYIIRFVFVAFLLFYFGESASAQYGTSLEGEFGFQAGTAHYFGDLNTRSRLKRPQPAFGVFFRKQLNNYAAFRTSVNFMRLGYSDELESDNEFQRRRNLNFETNVWEFLFQGDFNFFRFNPSDPSASFTPYLNFGLGLFFYDPYAFLDGEKYFLRPLGTEGQTSSLYPEKKEYGQTALAIPIGLGVKWALGNNVNFHFEVTHRFTGTDYLDDVSGTYAGMNAFSPGSPAALLQDRSYLNGAPIGVAGAQRGFKGNKDQYVSAVMGITFNITSYKCPSGN